ncbi:MAG: class I SAM-dependent methyltransferase [Clostridiaceae bacterium]|nr:class I SAM-dependent methyltransferase [Clostridiaceae bacterium]
MNKNELFFDSMAYKWDEMVNHNSSKIESVLESLVIKSSDSILDIGTGTGVLIPFLIDRLDSSGSITAIDISSKMLEIAKSKHDNDQVRFIKLDFMEAELQEVFDIVLCYSCFPHLNGRRTAVRKMLKVLKKGGKLAIFHSESRKKINQIHWNMDNPVKRDNLPAAEELKSVIEAEGGKVVNIEDSGEKYVIIATL